MGSNGSGKSTLCRKIVNQPSLYETFWQILSLMV
ncbi:hypothetical protein [Paenibacillus jilunlii]